MNILRAAIRGASSVIPGYLSAVVERDEQSDIFYVLFTLPGRDEPVGVALSGLLVSQGADAVATECGRSLESYREEVELYLGDTQ